MKWNLYNLHFLTIFLFLTHFYTANFMPNPFFQMTTYQRKKNPAGTNPRLGAFVYTRYDVTCTNGIICSDWLHSAQLISWQQKGPARQDYTLHWPQLWLWPQHPLIPRSLNHFGFTIVLPLKKSAKRSWGNWKMFAREWLVCTTDFFVGGRNIERKNTLSSPPPPKKVCLAD